ncbi:gliding motility protein GldL [Sphingobacterium shayense]|uniref:type IX secretion system motor protein PorL/GldL n=1 Tax=Sphingobacterium shayense TaxID=626343 RepID=UPI001555863C|nr:gliding motility protein GldL [Sphingobacterium shayense]NQD72580.1 gliding motility protein GldL [Sphingobacterium shayense]
MSKKRDNSRWLHVAISWGASIVIIGVLFKILHIGGSTANYMIGLGLIVEAILFFLMGFTPPPQEPNWARVYPELDENFQGELPTRSMQLAHTNNGPSTTAALDKMFADANIDNTAIENLGRGLKDFGEKVSAINKISDISLATEDFTQRLRSASSKFDNLSLAFEKASANLVEMSKTNTDTTGYHQQVQQLTNNLGQLNTMYERELRESASHLQSMNHFYENLSFTMKNFNESLDDSKAFKDEVNKLAKNLNALNAVYGNMLSAMNQPRV